MRAQLLDADRPTELLDTVQRLTLLQDDPTAAVAPNAELVAWTRLGAGASPYGSVAEATAELALVDVHGLLRPADDLRLYRAEMAAWPGAGDVPTYRDGQAAWVDANDGFRRDLLDELRREGPLTRAELPDTCVVPWRSSGWNNNRNVAMMLEMLVERGEVAVAGRRGRDRLWDLASRVYPDDDPVPVPEALRIRAERRLRALGLARERAVATPVEPNDVGPVGAAAVIDGVKGRWRVDPAYLDPDRLGGPFRGRLAVLSPLDRLVYDRARMVDLFAFDYQLEMYKPAAARRWGYWAMPVLDGDRLVGKVDATTDRRRGVLRIDAVHQDVPFGGALLRRLTRELTGLAAWLDVEALWPVGSRG